MTENNLVPFLGQRQDEMRKKRSAAELAPQFQSLEDILVTLLILALKIIQQLAAGVNHFDQSVTRAMILAVGLEMISESRDAIGQQSDLDAGRAAILLVALKIFFNL